MPLLAVAGLALACVALVAAAALGIALARARKRLAALAGSTPTPPEPARAPPDERTGLSVAQRESAQSAQSAHHVGELLQILDDAHAMPFVMRPSTSTLSWAAPQLGALLGASGDSLYAEAFLVERALPSERDVVRSELAHVVATPGAHTIDIGLGTERGALWLRLFAHCRALDDASTVVSGLAVDVTAQRRRETEERIAQKLESVGRLAEGVAHEINTPVGYVQNSLGFLENGIRSIRLALMKGRQLRAAVATPGSGASPVLLALAKAAERAEESGDVDFFFENVLGALDDSRAGLGKISDVVKSMHSFAQPGFTQQTAVDLNQQLRSVLLMAKPDVADVADVEAHLAPLPPVLCHASELNQALLHIVVNAGQAIAATGKKGLISVSSAHEDDCVLIRVSDNGVGIPSEIRERIFDPFFTTKDVGAAGQGLAVARAVVTKHQGSIDVESQPGSTTFTVRLPAGARAVVADNTTTRRLRMRQPPVAA